MSDRPHRLILPTPYPVGPVNLYLIPGDEPVLIDAGPGTDEAWAALNEGLATYNLRVSELRHLIITHAHLDHYGLAGRIVAESGARVYTHPYNAPLLTDFEREWERIIRFYGDVMRAAGVPAELLGHMGKNMQQNQQFNTQPLPITRFITDGDRLDLCGGPWEVLHTPGHALGAICLYQPQNRHLITADHLLPKVNSNPVVEPPPNGETERPRALADYLRSLQRIAKLEVRTAFPGHGEPITNHRTLIERRVRHRQKRAEQIQGLLTERGQTVYELARQVFGPQIVREQSFLTVSEIIGQLDILELNGLASMNEENGLWMYRAGPNSRENHG